MAKADPESRVLNPGILTVNCVLSTNFCKIVLEVVKAFTNYFSLVIHSNKYKIAQFFKKAYFIEIYRMYVLHILRFIFEAVDHCC